MKKAPKQITFFVQCLIDKFFPQIGQACLSIFRKLDIAVDIPSAQTCCGQPEFNAGQRHAAYTMACHFLDVFQHSGTIVCPSGSCVHMIRHHYPVLFATDKQKSRIARRLADNTYEFSEFLVDVVGVEDLGASFAGRVTYHASCHLTRGLGIYEQPLRLLSRIKNIQFMPMKDAKTCCGFGGVFSIKYPEISTAMVDEKIRNIINTGATTVVGCDMGCLMNIQGRLLRTGQPIQVRYIAQLLAGDQR
jgi:L-lactate dehydrogenase complex protein LldE